MVEGYPDRLGGWGAPAIFKEAGRLLLKYFRLLLPFVLAFFLPVALLELLQLLGLAWLVSHRPHHHPHPHPHPHPHHHHHHHHHHPHLLFGFFTRAFSVHSHEGNHGNMHSNMMQGSLAADQLTFAPSPHPHPPHPPHPPPILPLLIALAVGLVIWLLISLAVASITKAIAHIYNPSTSDDPSVTKSIFRSLPGTLYRIFITTLWIILFSLITSFLISLPFHVLVFLFRRKLNFHIVAVLNQIAVNLAQLVLGFVLLLALEVSALESETYGLAALQKSWALVKSKLAPALVFFLVWLVVVGLLSKLAQVAVLVPATGVLPFWTVYIFAVLWALLFLVLAVYFLVAAVVLYFACKLKSHDDQQYLPVNAGDDNPYTPLVVPSEN